MTMSDISNQYSYFYENSENVTIYHLRNNTEINAKFCCGSVIIYILLHRFVADQVQTRA